MTTFLLIRHGLTDLVDRAISGWMPGVHLNETGRGQALGLAERLARAPIAAIYSSPLERARETAEPLAERLGLEIRLLDELGEIRFGEWTGRTLDELSGEPLWQRFNALRSLTRVPGGELMLETRTRVIEALARLRRAQANELIAVVSHGDVIRAAVTYYAGVPLDLFQRIEIGPASVSVVEVSEYGPRLLRLNDTGSLF